VFGSDDDGDESVLFHPTSVCVDGEGIVYILDSLTRVYYGVRDASQPLVRDFLTPGTSL